MQIHTLKVKIIALILPIFIGGNTLAGDLESDLLQVINQRHRSYIYNEPRDADALLPQIGTVGATTITTQEERVFGEYFFKKARQHLNIIDDPVLDEYIDTLGSKLISHANNVHFPFNFFLVHDQSLNAAAFLGGNVKIHSGLFNYADNESQLASVLAHEITHVTQRHLARFIEDAYSRQAKTLGAIVGSIVLTMINPTIGMAALNATLALNIQNTINYTRSDELEADHIGIDLLYRAGFDPNQMAVFFNKLTSNYYHKIPQNLIDHPIPEVRVADARNRALRYPPSKVSENINFYFAKARIFVRYSTNDADFSIKHFSTLLEKNNSTNRYNRNYLLYGLCLAYIEKKDYSNALKYYSQISNEYKDNLFMLDTFADLELLRNNTSEVIRVLKDRLKYTPKSPTILVNLAVAYLKANQAKEAIKLLQFLTKNDPKNLMVLDLQVDCYKALNMKLEYYTALGKRYALVSDYTKSNLNFNYAYQYAMSKLDKAKINALIVLNEQNRKSDAQFENL